MRPRWTLTIIFLTMAGTLLAQDYLVTTRMDTLRGKITIQTHATADRASLVIEKKKTEYQAYGVLAVCIDTTTYVPVRTKDAFRFMRLKKKGMVSLCYAQQSPGTPYNVPYLVKISGESMEVTALRFRKTVSVFLGECATVTQKIEQESLGRNDLEKIVDSYNQCLDKQTTVAFSTTENPKLVAINTFNTKLGNDGTVPEDAKEILRDLYNKIKEGKQAPNYLIEGLREALGSHPAYTADLENLITVLKK